MPLTCKQYLEYAGIIGIFRYLQISSDIFRCSAAQNQLNLTQENSCVGIARAKWYQVKNTTNLLNSHLETTPKTGLYWAYWLKGTLHVWPHWIIMDSLQKQTTRVFYLKKTPHVWTSWAKIVSFLASWSCWLEHIVATPANCKNSAISKDHKDLQGWVPHKPKRNKQKLRLLGIRPDFSLTFISTQSLNC